MSTPLTDLPSEGGWRLQGRPRSLSPQNRARVGLIVCWMRDSSGAPAHLVRDEGVAGSNPATPTTT
jgi:hypothetical protein